MSNVLDFRPRCANYGCKAPVSKMSSYRYRAVCSSCHKASYGAGSYKSGVTPFRTGRCLNNETEILGFKCPVNYKKALWALGMTEIDHIDGNHLNNELYNLMELCPMCHNHKGKLAGDFVNNRYANAA